MVRSGQACIEGLLTRLVLRVDELADDGRAALGREVLTGRGQVRARRARSEAARGDLARRSAELGAVLTSGSLGPDHLDSLARRLGRLDDDTLGRLDHQAIAHDATRLPADTFDAALRRTVAAVQHDGGTAEAEAARSASEVRHWFNQTTGMGHLTARLDPERYEAVVAAIDQHTSSLASAGGPSPGEVRTKNANLTAEALVDLICSSGARRAHLPHITVVVDQETLRNGRHPRSVAQTGDGHDLGDQSLARLCCDAVLRRVVSDDHGLPINVGRRHRTATDAQWTALRSIYSTCAWNSCDRPLRHCQAHHLQPWQQGGSTDLANLVPLCSHHHHLVHEGRWHLELLPDRSLRISRPDGQLHTTTPPPTRRPPPTEGWKRPPPLGTPCTLTTESLVGAGVG